MGWAAILALILELLKVVVPIVTQPHLMAGSGEMDPTMFPDAVKARVMELAACLRVAPESPAVPVPEMSIQDQDA